MRYALLIIALIGVANTDFDQAFAQKPSVNTTMHDHGAIVEVYKSTQDANGNPVDLHANIFYPQDHKPKDQRPAVVFYFGGGWKSGSPTQFLKHCQYLASRGMVAIAADYRVRSRHQTLATACVADGKSAVRWIRKNAKRLGVDPSKIVAAGGSAGGHVAACTAVVNGFDDSSENLAISSRPNALALFNPALVLDSIDNRAPLDPEKVGDLRERMGVPPRQLSPIHHLAKGLPPCIVFHGKSDETVPYWTASEFRDRYLHYGNTCVLVGFEGEEHGFFNHGRGDNSSYERSIRALDRFLVEHKLLESLDENAVPVVQLDLDGDRFRQVVVDREPGQYLGHPTTCLLEDGKTILCVYPKGHGKGGIVYKRSPDGGLTWSDRIPTPENWSTSKEVPTLHRVIDAAGKKRLIMWSGLYPARLAVSEDDGENWSPLKPVGNWGGIVVMGFVEPLRTGDGHYLAMFHDDGRFFQAGGKRSQTFTLYQTLSHDGGLTWSHPTSVYQSSEMHLCEPGCIRSPDGKTLAVLLRENARRQNSQIIFSKDEGKTWTDPRPVPLVLTGDRHTGKYTSDGRLFISYRCNSPRSQAKQRPFEGDWVGWVGTWDDLVSGGQGQYFVRLKDNTHLYDTAYPGVEVLPDDTVVTTTYGHWVKDQPPYILSVRLKLSELDAAMGR